MPKAFLCCQVNGLLQKLLAVSAATILRGDSNMGDVGGSRRIVVHIACAETDQRIGIPQLCGSGVLPNFTSILDKINAIYMRLTIYEMCIDILGVYLVYGNMYHIFRFYSTLPFPIGHFYGQAICFRFLFLNTF